jgi:hypothetical protein
MGTMFIKNSRKTKIEMVGTSRRGFKKDESKKLEKEVQREKMVERNHKAGQNPPRVVAPTEEEEEEEEEEEYIIKKCKRDLVIFKALPSVY